MPNKPTYFFDIEANGLIRDVTKVFHLAFQDVETGTVYSYRNNTKENTIPEGLEKLSQAHRLVAHNGVMYDGPVLKKLYNLNLPPIIDTLLISRLVYPDRYSNPVGAHGLEAWGRFLKKPKLAQPPTLLEEWTPETETYCIGDVALGTEVYKYLLKLIYKLSPKIRPAIKLEHQVAKIILDQVVNGFTFNSDAALELRKTLELEEASVFDELQKTFPPTIQKMKSRWWKDENGKLWNTKKEAPTKNLVPGPHKEKIIPFNPGSRPQIVERFQQKYGWKPTKLTEHGSPIMDEKVLASLKFPEARLLEKFLLVQKRQSQIDQWFKNVDAEGLMHGDVITNGCVTGRMSHANPNMAQVPAGYSPYGHECRACFGPKSGYYLVGIDASGLELRMLAHELARFDSGVYAAAILNGDIHTHNQLAAGIETRDQAKTFIYAFLYGAGARKLGSIVEPDKPSRWLSAGTKLKEQFIKNIPGLDRVKQMVEVRTKKHGWLIGLDGRPLPVRSEHMALNTLLQSHGAVIMKTALRLFAADSNRKQTWEFCANVHDEWQVEVRMGQGDEDCRKREAVRVGELGVHSIMLAGLEYHLGCPLTGEYKIGLNWRETH